MLICIVLYKNVPPEIDLSKFQEYVNTPVSRISTFYN